MPSDNTTLTKDALRLLRTYEQGPRIWDAAAILPVVWVLAGKGLIKPAGDSGAYEITESGRRVLADQD
jgi:hypothetical protein